MEVTEVPLGGWFLNILTAAGYCFRVGSHEVLVGGIFISIPAAVGYSEIKRKNISTAFIILE